MRLLEVIGFNNLKTEDMPKILSFYAIQVNMGTMSVNRATLLIAKFFGQEDIDTFNKLLNDAKPIKIGDETFLPPIIISAPISKFNYIRTYYKIPAGIMDKRTYPKIALATLERTATELILHRYPYRRFVIIAFPIPQNYKVVRLLAYLSTISKYYEFMVLEYGKYQVKPDNMMKKQIKKFIEVERTILKGGIEIPEELENVDSDGWWRFHEIENSVDKEAEEISLRYNIPVSIVRSFLSTRSKETALEILQSVLPPSSTKFKELMDLWMQRHR